VFDIFVMLALMSDTRRVRGDRRALRRALEICSLRELVMRELPFSVAVLTGSALTLLLPNIFGLFSFFGDYIYTAEFTFLALLFMRVVAVACVYAGDLRNTAAIKRMLTLTPLQIGAGIALLFTLICLLTPMGALFGLVRSPLFYTLISVVPAIGFAIAFEATVLAREKEKRARKKM